MSLSLNGLRFTLNVDGLVEMALAVVNFHLHQSYSAPFSLKVDIASGLFDLTAESFLEKNAKLTIWQGLIPVRSVSGLVAGVTLGESNSWQMRYQLSIRPPFWRSGLRQNFRIFQQQDIKTISSLLLKEDGVTEWTSSLYEAHPAREFCVQYGETDLAFLTRLWAEEGILFFDNYVGDEAVQTMTLCDDVSGLPQAGVLSFNPNTTAGVSTEYVSEFRYRAQIRPSQVESQDYTFTRPGWPGYYQHRGEHLNGQQVQYYEVFDYPGRFKDEQHGKDFTRYQMEGLRNDAETAAGISNSSGLWPGVRFTLAAHPSETLNREWQVVSSVLEGQQPQALHGSRGQGTTMTNNFEVIPADRTWRLPPLPKPKVDGPQSAEVTGPEGEELFCDEHGRVRVKFLWDRYNPMNENSSCWVRVSQAWAGTGFGNLAIPRVGQEVIVDFLNGDPDQPIIMGRTYHEDNRSPGNLPGTKTQMSIRSKTYKGEGFNELRFEDATSNEQVYIHAQKNMDTEVLNNRTTDVKVDHTETIGNNQKITVDNDQTVTVKNDQKLDVTHNRRKDVGNDQNSQVVGNDTEDVLKSQTITVGKHFSLTVTNSSTIDSGDVIELKCGASLLRMDSAGRVTITGAEFLFEATGPVHINGKDVHLN